jgi:hypothetical protein
MRNTSPAATANDPASKKNGRAKLIESIALPTIGPTKAFAVSSAPHNRPLAFSSNGASTMAGMSVWPQLSRSTSASPRNRVATRSTA